MSDYLRGVIFMALVLTIVWPTPAGANPDIPTTSFALWPADYCAQARGDWSTAGSSPPVVDIAVTTYSRRAPGGSCDTASTASANTFSAWAKVDRYSGGAWALCKQASWEGNATGAWQVKSTDADLPLCGSGTYRLRSENRITYGGTNQYSPPYTSGSAAL